MRKINVLLVGLITVLGTFAGSLLLFAGSADAHQNEVTGVAVCDAQVGSATWTVTWTVANDYNLAETATLAATTGGGTLTGLPVGITASPGTPYNTAIVTQFDIPTTSATATLQVHGAWSDGFSTDSAVASVDQPASCVPLPPPTTTTTTTTTTTAPPSTTTTTKPPTTTTTAPVKPPTTTTTSVPVQGAPTTTTTSPPSTAQPPVQPGQLPNIPPANAQGQTEGNG